MASLRLQWEKSRRPRRWGARWGAKWSQHASRRPHRTRTHSARRRYRTSDGQPWGLGNRGAVLGNRGASFSSGRASYRASHRASRELHRAQSPVLSRPLSRPLSRGIGRRKPATAGTELSRRVACMLARTSDRTPPSISVDLRRSPSGRTLRSLCPRTSRPVKSLLSAGSTTWPRLLARRGLLGCLRGHHRPRMTWRGWYTAALLTCRGAVHLCSHPSDASGGCRRSSRPVGMVRPQPSSPTAMFCTEGGCRPSRRPTGMIQPLASCLTTDGDADQNATQDGRRC